MHIHTLQKWQHSHKSSNDNAKAERITRWVIFITVFMMLGEIIAGTVFGSMALLADGWHMGTHAAALGITAFAFWFSRKHNDNPKFSFGTGKVAVLAGFASAICLLVVALLMASESIGRFFSPVEIHFNQSIGVAILGLIVNMGCAFLLSGKHHHHHHKGHHHHDHNLRAAYLHVLADAFTSVLAIVALFTAKMYGLIWMDPLMGVVGALVITHWSIGLLKETSGILLDSDVSEETLSTIRDAVESESDNRIADLHIWKMGGDSFAVIMSIVTHFPKPPEHYKELLEKFEHLAHVTVEVNPCLSKPCLAE